MIALDFMDRIYYLLEGGFLRRCPAQCSSCFKTLMIPHANSNVSSMAGKH